MLLEALASFSAPLDSVNYHQPRPDVPEPESLPAVEEQLSAYADEELGYWIRPQWIERRYVDPPPRLARDMPAPSAQTRMWWRPSEPVTQTPSSTVVC